jgi:DNA modification methylase
LLELNTIYNEDCLGENGLKLLPDNSIDLIITDPPYIHNKGGGRNVGTEGKSVIANSKMYNNHSEMIKKWSKFTENEINIFLDEAKRLMKKMNCYIFTNDTPILYYLKWAERNKKKFTILTWEKPLSILNRNRFSQNLEYIVRIYDSGTGLNMLDLDNFPEKKEYYSKNRKINPVKGKGKLHPVQKPIDYINGLIELSSQEGDVILDPYSGSGTTLESAYVLKRKFIGFEIDSSYYEVAANRINKIKMERENMLNFTNLYNEIIIGNKVEEYIKKNGQLVDDASLTLVEYGETSIFINCHWDEDKESWKPYYEIEDEGRLDFYDSFDQAFKDYKRLVSDKYNLAV